MRRLPPLICLAVLVLVCFGGVLFRGEQFGYRDAGHYYYPLYQRVQQVWESGRLPLWDARENAGMPLLGNPTAAVLYPGKLIYAVMPYPWAARMYVIAHTLLAALGMYLMMRSMGVSETGSAIGGLSYAFGAPILFQYCNVIYLVGAAWAPIGLMAADRWLRLGRRGAIGGLAVVLAMEVLGGDPETAYLTGLCAGGYALGLARSRRTRRTSARPWPRWVVPALLVVGVVAWVGLTLGSALVFPQYRAKASVAPPLPWSPWVPRVLLVVWAVLFLAARRWAGAHEFRWRFDGLLVAAVLAGGLSAAELVPASEYTSQTTRAAADGIHDIYPFSLEPFRVLECLWPGAFGSNRVAHRSWLSWVLPRHTVSVWVPSLYVGGLTLVLGGLAFSIRKGGAPRVWLSAIVGFSLVGSFGQFASPLYAARCVRGAEKVFGPRDELEVPPIRRDGLLRDGDGSPYGLMAIGLPGFASFRYPSKLFAFTCLGLCGLAGMGFDLSGGSGSRRASRASWLLAGISLVALAALSLGKAEFVAFLGKRADPRGISVYGPFQPEGAWAETRNALAHGVALFVVGGIVLRGLAKGVRHSGAAVLAVVTADLLLANSGLVLTVPQTVFETTPDLLRRIEEAEKADPSPGPFRIHRMGYWDNFGFTRRGSPDRNREMTVWQRDTLQPKYGMPLGVSYTQSEGVGELYHYWWFFSPFYTSSNLVYYPRRGFDLWNTRYFIVPSLNANDSKRAISSFRIDSTPVYPTPEISRDPKFVDRWNTTEDWRLLRNDRAYPRAWIVHSARIVAPVPSLRRSTALENLMLELVYQADSLWKMKSRPMVYDPRQVAWVETDDASALLKTLSNRPSDASETAKVVVLEDERVEIDVKLDSPGIVVLSDIYFPGWEMTIDRKPAPILKTNHMMRGALVPSGPHRLVYRYRPKSVVSGFALSGIGLIGLIATAIWARRGRPSPEGPRDPLLRGVSP